MYPQDGELLPERFMHSEPEQVRMIYSLQKEINIVNILKYHSQMDMHDVAGFAMFLYMGRSTQINICYLEKPFVDHLLDWYVSRHFGYMRKFYSL